MGPVHLKGIMNGAIFLDRKILDWEWYTNINTKVVFIHLLLKANWKDARWQGKIIKRGQLVSSIASISEQTALTPKEVRVAISHLISTGELGKQTTNKYTVFTVLNYDKYQSEGNQGANKGQPKGNLRATNEEEEKEINIYTCPDEPDERKEREQKLQHNFNTLYALYPKKVGKAKAFELYRGWVSKNGRSINGSRTHLTNEQMYRAIKKYVGQQEDNNTELQYYQGFDRFMNKTILDYVEEERHDTS